MSLNANSLRRSCVNPKKNITPFSTNIPNPVFVLDMHTLEILDCNTSVASVYGFEKEELIDTSFLALFKDESKDHYSSALRKSSEITQAVHRNKSGDTLYVNIRISPSEYAGEEVFLVTTSDITNRLWPSSN